MKSIIYISLVVLCINLHNSWGQSNPLTPANGQSLDKIVAVVGDEVILKSDLDGQLYFMSQMDKSIDINNPEARKKVLNSLIDQLLLVNKAIKDSVVVNDDEVTQRIELHIQSEIKRFGSEKRVEQVYGMSIPRMKNEIRDKIRQNLLVQSLVSQKFANLKATQKDIEDFYHKNKDSLPLLPPSIQLYHLVKKVEAGKETKQHLYDLAMKIRDSILAGGDFADFAKRYSGDPGTATEGGELGWFSKGKLFPEFENAAFKLSTGELSKPIETPFGFHLIQTIEKKTDAIKTRHILFKFGDSEEESQKAISFLEDIRKKVISGESFDSLATIYSDDKESRGFGGYLGNVSIDELPENIKSSLLKMKDGETSEPVLYRNEPNDKSYHILYKKKTLPQRKATLENDSKEIEAMATEFKKRDLYEEWVKELRSELYWEIIDK
ncbi:MAG TPA: peptidylprolyl isomerase [Candidatus Kapabacteria bacterium]|nr:peptidylprolyl isomerase [Candidatus Kapabacteria bacterium]